MARRRPRQVRVLLPGEKEGRRGFLKKGLLGAALLAAGGGSVWLATRRTRVAPSTRGLEVFDPVQLTVIMAVAERMIPDHPGFPRPAEVGLAAKVDAIAAMAHPAAHKELRQLLGLFESGFGGLLDLQPRLFTDCDAAGQDRRLRAWMTSRIAVRRTGFRALKRLVTAAYYASPEVWGAVGYPGPPTGAALREAPPPAPARREGPRPAAPELPAPAPAPPEEPPRPSPRRFRPAPVLQPAAPEPAPQPPGAPPGGDLGG
jgi:hypothetical protein